jgi:hypothetical protein
MGSASSHETADRINTKAHQILEKLREAIENTGYKDADFCEKFVQIYTEQLAQFGVESLKELGTRFHVLPAADTSAGAEDSEEYKRAVCAKIIEYYQLKFDIVDYLIANTQLCWDQSQKLNNWFLEHKSEELSPAAQSLFAQASELDDVVVGQFNQLEHLVDYVLNDRDITIEDLNEFFQMIKDTVQEHNAYCRSTADRIMYAAK